MHSLLSLSYEETSTLRLQAQLQSADRRQRATLLSLTQLSSTRLGLEGYE